MFYYWNIFMLFHHFQVGKSILLDFSFSLFFVSIILKWIAIVQLKWVSQLERHQQLWYLYIFLHGLVTIKYAIRDIGPINNEDLIKLPINVLLFLYNRHRPFMNLSLYFGRYDSLLILLFTLLIVIDSIFLETNCLYFRSLFVLVTESIGGYNIIEIDARFIL